LKSLTEITDTQLDVFREIATIGAGNAASALATILNMRLDMRVPSARIVPFREVTDLLNGPENIVVGIMIAMSGDLQGYIMLVQELKDARGMASLLLAQYNQDDTNPTDFSEMEASALAEIGNILISSYLSAISGMTGLSIMASVPDLVIDMAGAILSVPAIEYGEVGDAVLFLETQFSDAGKDIGGQFFLIPDLASYTVLMRALGVAD
jgi:chemotaxis protein CheC